MAIMMMVIEALRASRKTLTVWNVCGNGRGRIRTSTTLLQIEPRFIDSEFHPLHSFHSRGKILEERFSSIPKRFHGPNLPTVQNFLVAKKKERRQESGEAGRLVSTTFRREFLWCRGVPCTEVRAGRADSITNGRSLR